MKEKERDLNGSDLDIKVIHGVKIHGSERKVNTMGVMNHNVVIATTWSADRAKELQKWIDGLSNHERKLIVRTGSWANGYCTFIVAPDGSKEGWDTSDEGDALRERFIARLSTDNYEDDSSPWSWVEVGFGEYGQRVIRGNC